VRPLRIELEGFSAYREHVEVDFENVDFFSVTGPTGSGKSSLIDAMIFALYGRVPRLGGNAVAPVITSGADRARVRFDFEVAGERYTVARLAERSASGGASVREARLQRDGTVLASGASDVTNAVESLLRLRFDDFTKTVVLPQGEFARFLKAPPRERQELLRTLLGMDVYITVRDLARTRAAVAAERGEAARRSLETLDLADGDTRQAAAARVDSLTDLTERLPGLERTLGDCTAEVIKAAAIEDRMADAVSRLEAISPPARLEELESLRSQAQERALEADEAQRDAGLRLKQLEEELAARPSKDQVASWSRARDRLAEIEEKLTESDPKPAAVDAEETAQEVKRAKDDLEQVRSALTGARDEHAAHLLSTTLVVGEPCPVCAQRVDTLPGLGEGPDIAMLEEAVRGVESNVAELGALADKARERLVSIEATRAGLVEQRVDLEREVEQAPSVDEFADIKADLERLDQEHLQAKRAVDKTEEQAKKADDELASLSDDLRQVSKLLTAAQMKIGDLDPPISQADDVTVQWKELLQWRAERLDHLVGERTAAKEKTAELRRFADDARLVLIAELESNDVEPIEPFTAQVATALQAARSVVVAHEKALEESARLTTRLQEATEEAAVAEALTGHLRASGFERWLMDGALKGLVAGANDLLDQLSDGRYSLESSDTGSFVVIDHHNADEERSVATLSGGETFQASLAMALSLAETLAGEGQASLDAVIVDEGFGSLDTDEALDVAGSVLEELTSRFMVGVITHVKELAARAPVRYEVRREPTGSKVRLVS